jgi:Mn-containing catalase
MTMKTATASPTPAPAESFGVPQASFVEASGEAVNDLAANP